MLADMKKLVIWATYSESTSAASPNSVEKRQKQISPAYHAAARSLDAELDSYPSSPRPAESEPNTKNSGWALGLVAGAHAVLPTTFHVTTDLIASQLADEHLQFFDLDHRTWNSVFFQQARRSLGLALRRGWAKLLLGRCRNPVQHPIQL